MAETALADLAAGRRANAVVPVWRVIAAGSPVARRLTCDPARIADLRAREAPSRPR